jgi:hypothetical protein
MRTPMPGRLTCAIALLGAVVLAACGSSSTTQKSTPQGGATASTKAVELVYDESERVEGQRFRVHADVIVLGTDHARLRLSETGMGSMLFVWDGHRLLVHSPEDSRPWGLYDVPSEHPDQFNVLRSYLPDPGAAFLKQQCTDVTVVGHKQVNGQSATGYRCPAQHHPDGSSQSAFTVWIDDSTGLTVPSSSSSHLTVRRGVHVDASTFSTEPPPGAEVTHYGPEKVAKAAPFTLKRRDGSTVALSDYHGKPLVLVFASSDLAFAPEDDPEAFAALRAVASQTSGGRKPSVLLIQFGDEGKPGFPLKLPGVGLDTALDPSAQVESAYGLDGQLALAFVGSDGSVHRTFNRAPSADLIRSALAALD